MTKFARRCIVTTILSVSLTSPAIARGLKQLQPGQANEAADASPEAKAADANDTNQEKPVVEDQADSPQEDSSKEVEVEVERPVSEDKVFVGSSLSWVNLKANKGGWHTGFSSDLVAGYRVASLMKERLYVYTTIRYLPIDVVVKHEGQQYRGIVENYLVGGLASYKQGALIYQAGLELGATDTKLSSIDPYLMDGSLEKSGVNITSSAGLVWSPWPGVQLGGRLYLGAGTFTSIQTAANVNFSL